MRQTLPPPGQTALLLDLDGTLLDIAPTPETVEVPRDLPSVLLRLRTLCGGALAIITGRPIEQIDALLPDIPTAIAGEHGAALRRAAGAATERPALPTLPAAWIAAAEALAARLPGVRVERKAHGLVLHYRAAPDAAGPIEDALRRLTEREDRFRISPSKMAWELRPAGADKGVALVALMTEAPFRGRKPVFIGDDVTDQDAIEAARAMGGVGLFVPEDFGEPADVRAWLAHLATGPHAWETS